MQIKIRYNSTWILANPDYVQAYQNYKNQPIYHPEEPVTTGRLTVYRTNNDVYLPTFIRDGTAVYPIADFEDVRVFLLDLNPVDWYAARNYQVWAYYDFMYDNQQKKTYASKNSYSQEKWVRWVKCNLNFWGGGFKRIFIIYTRII